MSEGLEKELEKWDNIVKKRFENNQISEKRYEEYKHRSKELKESMLKLGEI